MTRDREVTIMDFMEPTVLTVVLLLLLARSMEETMLRTVLRATSGRSGGGNVSEYLGED